MTIREACLEEFRTLRLTKNLVLPYTRRVFRKFESSTCLLFFGPRGIRNRAFFLDISVVRKDFPRISWNVQKRACALHVDRGENQTVCNRLVGGSIYAR